MPIQPISYAPLSFHGPNLTLNWCMAIEIKMLGALNFNQPFYRKKKSKLSKNAIFMITAIFLPKKMVLLDQLAVFFLETTK